MERNFMIKELFASPIKILFLLVLLFSTISINAAPIIYGTQIAGIIICLLIAYYFYGIISKKLILLSATISIVILALSLYQFSYLEYKDIFWRNTIRTLFWINSAVIFYGYFAKFLQEEFFLSVIKLLIALNSIVVVLQFISFYIFNIEIDFSLLLGGEGVRSYYNALQGLNYRPTGLTSEPAIHSAVMFGLLVIYYILNNHKNSLLSLLGLASIILTFSTLGVVMVLIYFALVYTKKRSTIILGLILALIIVFFTWDSLVARYDIFVSGNDLSNNLKYNVFQYFLSERDFILSGLGFIGKARNAPKFYDALYDMTYFFNVYIYFGAILGTSLLIFSIYLLIKSEFSIREKLLILAVFIKLAGPTFMFFNFFIMSLFLLNHFKVMKK